MCLIVVKLAGACTVLPLQGRTYLNRQKLTPDNQSANANRINIGRKNGARLEAI